MTTYTVLHLTHTDIRYDSRILKELACLSEFNNIKLTAFSLILDEGNQISSLHHNCKIKLFDLLSDRLPHAIPRPFGYSFKLLELTFRFFIKGLKVKPDIVHCHDTIALIPGFLLSIFLGSHLVS